MERVRDLPDGRAAPSKTVQPLEPAGDVVPTRECQAHHSFLTNLDPDVAMKTRLGRLTIVGLWLALFPPLTIGYGQQTRPSPVAPAVTVPGTFPVEETTVGQLLGAYRSGKATAHDVTQAYIDVSPPTTNAARISTR